MSPSASRNAIALGPSSSASSASVRERVLDDGEARAALEEAGAQLVDLRHRQAAVVGDEHRLRSLQTLRQLGDNLFFLFSLHLTSTGLPPSQGGLPVVFGGSVARPEL
jgi:hypothetical protein